MTEGSKGEKAFYEDVRIIRLALVKSACNGCDLQNCIGCPLDEHRVVQSYFKDEEDDYVDEKDGDLDVL